MELKKTTCHRYRVDVVRDLSDLSLIGKSGHDDATGFDFHVQPDGVRIDMSGHSVSMDAHAAHLHQSTGRERYDTPASISACGCEECNQSRKSYGKRRHGWTSYQMVTYGRIDGYTIGDICADIEERLIAQARSK